MEGGGGGGGTVGVDGMSLDKAGELVGDLRRNRIEYAQEPEVEHRGVLSQEAVAPGLFRSREEGGKGGSCVRIRKDATHTHTHTHTATLYS